MVSEYDCSKSKRYCNDIYFVSKVWQELIRCTSTFGQAVRTHAEQLQTSTIDKIANLIKDKQSLKKSYAEQRDRLDNQLLQVSG